MAFPTTIEEALVLSPEQAENYLDVLLDLEDKFVECDLPDDFVDREPNFMLASMIDMLNRIAQLPDHPLGLGGWVAMLEEGNDGYEEDSGSSNNS